MPESPALLDLAENGQLFESRCKPCGKAVLHEVGYWLRKYGPVSLADLERRGKCSRCGHAVTLTALDPAPDNGRLRPSDPLLDELLARYGRARKK